MVFAVLLPPRVTAVEGWLASVRERRVCTDALVALYSCGPVAQRLVLRDAYGGRVELTPQVLAANPLLWHLLDAGARRSRERRMLRSGTGVLQELAVGHLPTVAGGGSTARRLGRSSVPRGWSSGACVRSRLEAVADAGFAIGASDVPEQLTAGDQAAGTSVQL